MRHPAEGIAPTPAQLIAVIAVMLAVWMVSLSPMLREKSLVAPLSPVSAGVECRSEQDSITKDSHSFVGIAGLMSRIVEEIDKVKPRFASWDQGHTSSFTVTNNKCASEN